MLNATMNKKPLASRKKRTGPRCIRCFRAKKGPCLGGKPACDNCRAKNLVCVWDDDEETGATATTATTTTTTTTALDDELTFTGQAQQPNTFTAPANLTHSLQQNEYEDNDNNTYELRKPGQKRKRTQNSNTVTNPYTITTNITAAPSTHPHPPGHGTKRIHTENLHYQPSTHTTLLSPPRHPPRYTDATSDPAVDAIPLRYRYPSPVEADFVQLMTPVRHNQAPVTLLCPRVRWETTMEEMGDGDGEEGFEEEWRRLGEMDTGLSEEGKRAGEMVWPGGRWVEEREGGEGGGVWRWVR